MAASGLSFGVRVFSLSLRRASSIVVAHRLSCPAACGILVPRSTRNRDQGSNPRPSHWKADSLPLDHQGSPQSRHSDFSNSIYFHLKVKKSQYFYQLRCFSELRFLMVTLNKTMGYRYSDYQQHETVLSPYCQYILMFHKPFRFTY